MSDIERIEQRLSAVERAVIDGDLELAALDDVASLAENLEALAERIDVHEQRIAELEGRIDALDGLVGSVESVNETVEQRANGAVAAVDRLEYRIDELERVVDTGDPDTVRGTQATRDGVSSDNGAAVENEARIPNHGETVGVREQTVATPDSAPDRSDRAAAVPVVSDDQTDASLPVEQAATEIVSAPVTNGESPNRQDDLTPDDRAEPTTTSDEDARSRREATQDSLDCRLAESADGDRSSGESSPDEDDESESGVLQLIRSKLP
ncbi:hypothetical protein HYG81_06470 [Natrinema zhouii]|uniref:DUF7310 domain-containing protein n=1 Tax=Natrinema zhouii TaxID=1710539 RepID=A0A7D6GSV3_9EURY|nr:hypothetical protein [Natrinema zhouii]QLK27243.1 hypothetical protein HYG81_06470 [Natrinema zhouii]